MTIKEIRKISGLSQIEFGKKYNIPVQTIKKWEANPNSSNHRNCPTYVKSLLKRVVMLDFENKSSLKTSSKLEGPLESAIATLAIEDMYLSSEFVSKLKKLKQGKEHLKI